MARRSSSTPWPDMLRTGLAIACVLIILAALICSFFGPVVFWPALLWPVIVLLGLAFERWRYRRAVPNVPKNFTPTGERFEDPESGHIFEVAFDAATGERRYVDTGVIPPASAG